jgi:hypothetical protein
MGKPHASSVIRYAPFQNSDFDGTPFEILYTPQPSPTLNPIPRKPNIPSAKKTSPQPNSRSSQNGSCSPSNASQHQQPIAADSTKTNNERGPTFH